MSATSEPQQAAIEIKGRMLTVTVLRVHTDSVQAVLDELQQRVSRSGALLRELPLVLELCVEVALEDLVGALRQAGFAPVAVSKSGPVSAQALQAVGLPAITLSAGGYREKAPARVAAATPEPAAAPVAEPAVESAEASGVVAARIVTEPVRSGQRIYAQGRDMVVLAQVSAGAEVIADGSIHIYAPLRGRALAGARGDAAARIFCLQFAAELVAVAGCYRLTEDLPAEQQLELHGQSAQVWLDGEQLHIQRLHGH